MNVLIRVLYRGHNEYLVTVAENGRVVETLPAYDYNVARVRNKACARYSQLVSCAEGDATVEAEAIPKATDMRRRTDAD